MNKQTPLVIKLLKDYGFEIACETNGTFPYMEGIDYVTCSPKRDAEYKVHEGLWDHVSEFKYVVDEDFDFKILDRHTALGNTSEARLSLSPEFNDMAGSVKKISDYIQENPWWRMSLQTHKFIGVK